MPGIEPFKRFSDLAGVRIIFYNKTDMKKAIKLFKNSGDFVDFKQGGVPQPDDRFAEYKYRAIHFDVVLDPDKRCSLPEYCMLNEIPCEIQFRTIFAHSWSKVHHALSYKQMDEMNLSTGEQQQLDTDFKEAAKNLESIEQQITDLCAKYYPNTKSISNAN